MLKYIMKEVWNILEIFRMYLRQRKRTKLQFNLIPARERAEMRQLSSSDGWRTFSFRRLLFTS